MANQQITGTPKQIAWAQALRADRLNELDEIVMRQLSRPNADRQRIERESTVLREALAAKTSAVWWIDHRGHPLATLANEIANEIIGKSA